LETGGSEISPSVRSTINLRSFHCCCCCCCRGRGRPLDSTTTNTSICIFGSIILLSKAWIANWKAPVTAAVPPPKLEDQKSNHRSLILSPVGVLILDSITGRDVEKETI